MKVLLLKNGESKIVLVPENQIDEAFIQEMEGSSVTILHNENVTTDLQLHYGLVLQKSEATDIEKKNMTWLGKFINQFWK